MPKRVKKQEFFFIHPFKSFQCIQFVEKQYFSVANNREGEGEGIVDYAPSGLRVIWLDKTGTLHI